jgi:hypothetical protein
MSLQWANRGLEIAICGQSNTQGFATGAVSALPEADPIDGHTLQRTLPPTARLFEDGVELFAYTNPFGLEVGILSVLTSAILLKRGENGTNVGSWGGGAGHMSNAVADWNSLGRKPKVLVWLQGEADAADATGTLAANYPTNFTDAMGVAKAQAGAAMGVLALRIPVTDEAGYPQAPAVREATRLWCLRDDLTGRCHAYYDPTSLPWYSAVNPLQADGVHLTGLAMYRLGRAVGTYLQAQGYG